MNTSKRILYLEKVIEKLKNRPYNSDECIKSAQMEIKNLRKLTKL